MTRETVVHGADTAGGRNAAGSGRRLRLHCGRSGRSALIARCRLEKRTVKRKSGLGDQVTDYVPCSLCQFVVAEGLCSTALCEQYQQPICAWVLRHAHGLHDQPAVPSRSLYQDDGLPVGSASDYADMTPPGRVALILSASRI